MITGWEYPKDISNPFPLAAALYPTPTKVRVFLYPSENSFNHVVD